MATKKCPNGHQYDSSIYGDNCPFCPSASATSAHTVVNENYGGKTKVAGTTGLNTERPTIPVNNGGGAAPAGGGATVIRRVGDTGDANGGRRLVGMLVTYNTNPLGEVFKVYEGRNIVGRAADCDIVITNDNNVSSHHLLVLFVDAEGIYWAEDQHSSNGTYINGTFARGLQELHTGDVIVIGATKLLFVGIPSF